MAATIWEGLSAISPIIAPIVTLSLVVAGRIIWNHEQRLRDVERTVKRLSRTIYGDADDIQQTGLAQDIHALNERIDKMEDQLDRIERRLDEIMTD